MRTVGGSGAGHANNFDFIRWLAASMVVASHEYAVLGRGGEEPLARLTGGFATFGTVGVDVFFVVSGYLIARSMVRRNDLAFFAASRLLRIYPGLVVALLVSVLGIGLFATTLPAGAYLRHPATWSYVWHGLALHDLQWTLPGVFAGLPQDGIVNGSLWSLWPEMRMYITVAALGAASVLLRVPPRIVLVVGMAIMAAYAFAHHPDPAGRVLESAAVERLAPLFAFGALIGLAPWRPLVALALLCVAAAGVAAARGTPFFVFAVDVALALGVVCLARAPIPRLSRFGRYGDWSYGIYIYAFPVQQAVAFAWPRLTLTEHFAIVYPLVLVLGALSWHLVEAPALAVKRMLRRPALGALVTQPRG